MENLKKVSAQSKDGKHIPLYYDIKNDAVYTESGDGRTFITYLIRHNTEDEIEEVVRKIMSL